MLSPRVMLRHLHRSPDSVRRLLAAAAQKGAAHRGSGCVRPRFQGKPRRRASRTASRTPSRCIARPSSCAHRGRRAGGSWANCFTIRTSIRSPGRLAPAGRRSITKPGPGFALLGLCEYETKEYARALDHINEGRRLGLGEDPQARRVVLFHAMLLLTRFQQYDSALQVLEKVLRTGDAGSRRDRSRGTGRIAPAHPAGRCAAGRQRT